MRIVKQNKVESIEAVFEPGNVTRYYLVLTKVNKDTLVVSDLNEKKAIILDPEFPSIKSFRNTIYKYGYSSSDAFAMASFIFNVLEEERQATT